MINLQEFLKKMKPEVLGWMRHARYNDGWLEVDETATYASATSITIPVDLTDMFPVGTRLRLIQNAGTWCYFVVVSTSVDVADVCTINLTGGSDYTVANETITRLQISYMSGSQPGWPGWFTYAPTETGWASLTANVARFAVEGRRVHLVLRVTGTSDDTAATVSLPIAARTVYGTSASWSGALGYSVDSGSALTAAGIWAIVSGGTSIVCYKTSALGAWTNSGTKTILLEAFYEI